MLKICRLPDCDRGVETKSDNPRGATKNGGKMGKIISVGFIGTGGISGAHLGVLKARGDVKIAALCDTNAERLAKRKDVYGGECFADFNEMLDKVELDAVWLCTPPAVRGDPLLACADKQIPVFCEKPVGVDIKEATRVAAELAKRKAHVQVGYVFRSMPAVSFLQKAMKDDSVHTVQSFYSSNVGISMGLPGWMYDKTKSGGFLVDQATHNLDLLRFLFGEAGEIRGISANPVRKKDRSYSVEDTVGVLFMLNRKIIATHTHTIVGDGWRNEIVMSGEKRIYRLDPGRGQIMAEGKCAGAPEEKDGTLAVQPDGKSWVFQQNPGSIMIYENARFVEQVVSGDWTNNPSSFEDGVKTLALALDCDRVAESGHVE
jgi:predicted dehydrogenase